MEVAELQRKSLIRIVDDDPLVRESLSFLLKVKGWSVIAYENAEAFLEGERFNIPGCVILDIRMASMSGLELQIYLERNLAKIPIIFITAHGEVDSAVHTMKPVQWIFCKNRSMRTVWIKLFFLRFPKLWTIGKRKKILAE